MADRWAALRAGDLWGSSSALLAKAIDEALPEHRRRHLAGPTIWPHDLKTRIAEHIRAMRAKLQATTTPAVPQEIPQEPQVVTVEVERAVDPERILARFSPGELIGRGIDRLFTRGTAEKILARTPAELLAGTGFAADGLAKALAHTNGTAKPEPEPVEARPRTWRVLVCGLMGDQRRHVEDKARTLHNVTLTFQDSDKANHVASGRFDHVLLMRKFINHRVTHGVTESVGKDRIHYVDGGQTELMQQLAKINSVPRNP